MNIFTIDDSARCFWSHSENVSPHDLFCPISSRLFGVCLSVCLSSHPCVSAAQVRAELQSCVSRQQEALRCREVWLLDQIELLEQLKTETLQQQLHQLHWVSLYWFYWSLHFKN